MSNLNPDNNCIIIKEPSSKLGEIVKLLVGFICTGIIGTMITNHYKNKEAFNAKHQEAVKFATSVFYDIIDTCSKRHYYAYRACTAYDDELNLSNAEVAERWVNYDKMVIYWNENRLRNCALLKRYFGYEMEDHLYKVLVPDFSQLHKMLYQYKKNPDNKELRKQIGILVTNLDDKISDFSNKLQAVLKNNDKLK